METNLMEMPTQLVKETEMLVAELENYKIETQPEYVFASEDLKRIKTKQKLLDDVRKSMTTPLDDSKKRIMEFFSKPKELLEQAESRIKKAILAFQTQQEQIKKEEEAKLAELLKQNPNNNLTQTNLIVETKIEKVEGISTKTIWRHRVVDINKVPREYLIVDDKKLAGIATATKGSFQIEGIEFYSEKILSARGA